MGEERFLTVHDIAKQLDVREETVRRWLRGRKLQGIPLVGRAGYRVSEQELRRFLSARLREKREPESPSRAIIADSTLLQEDLLHIVEWQLDGLIILDRSWRYLYLNQNAARILLFPREQLLGHMLWESFGELFGTANDTLERNLRMAMKLRKSTVCDYRSVQSEQWIRASISPCRQGLVISFTNLILEPQPLPVFDSTVQLRSEPFSLELGAWMSDAYGAIEYLSESFLHLLGMTFQECRSQGWFRLLPSIEAQTLHQQWQHNLQRAQRWDARYHLLGSDGVYHTIQTRGYPVRDDANNVVRWIGIHLEWGNA